MTICQFFLQGRCRFGDRCWNEHPRAGGAGGGRQQPQQQPSGGNRHGWNTTSQRYSSVIQPSSFSKSTPWGGSRDQGKPSFTYFDSGASAIRNRGFGFSQNPFVSLSPDEEKDEKKVLEGIVKDMEVWESSGQWMFSVYSPMKKKPNISELNPPALRQWLSKYRKWNPIDPRIRLPKKYRTEVKFEFQIIAIGRLVPTTSFTDISPEELRLEYHNYLSSNNLQSYLNSLQQLISQWKNRVNELKNLNISNKVALLFDVNDGVNQAAPTFGFGSGQATAFGSPSFPANSSSTDKPQNFSFKPNSGFVTAPSGGPSVFGNPPAFGATAAASSAITTSTPTFGFGKPEITSASSFSFKSPAASGLGSPRFSGFPTSLAAGPVGIPAVPGFGSCSSMAAFGNPGSQSNTAFSKPSNNIFGNSNISSSLPVSNGSTTTDNVLFTPKDQLTAEELEQFQSKKFSLGKIPLKPPPLELINI